MITKTIFTFFIFILFTVNSYSAGSSDDSSSKVKSNYDKAMTIWGTSSSWTLTALPLFVWMGEILFRTKLSENLFKGLSPWLSKLPGGLIHVNVVGCGLFAAISGSSAATVATVGKMSIPELRKRKYPEKILLGSLAGSGTLGLLIPAINNLAIESSIVTP